jgi:hypothetical protein
MTTPFRPPAASRFHRSLRLGLVLLVWTAAAFAAHSAGAAAPPADCAAQGRGGMTYVNWTFGVSNLTDLSMDITFYAAPRPPAAVYLQLYDFKIGGTPQYFGFQYAGGTNGSGTTQFIWSRWGTRDTAHARVAAGGTIESAGYEGDFVGIRYPYAWGMGTYTVNLAMRETDAGGTWYEMKVRDHSRNQWTTLGRLRFPGAAGGPPFIADGGGSWCEVFGGTSSPRDIGAFRLSYDGIFTRDRTVPAREARFSYGEATPNSDISLDPDLRRVHVHFGGDTRRVTPAGTYPLDPNAQPDEAL